MTTIDPRSSPLPACKPSGWKWLKALPKHWEARRLKHCLGVNESTLPETTDPDLEFRYIEIGAVNSGDLVEPPAIIRFSAAPSRARRIVKGGDTIVSTVRTYLKAVWYAEDPGDNLICSTGFAVLTPKQGTVPKFASYVAQSAPFTDQVTAESVGIAYPAIGEKKLGDLRIGLPPPEEQTAIVRYLDEADQQIQAYLSAKKKLIALLAEQRQAVIHQAVTRGLDPNVRLKPSGVEWLGEVPEHWETVKIQDLASRKAKSFTDGDWIESPYITTEGIRLIQTGNIGVGRYLEKGYRYISEKTFEELHCTEVTRNDILICRLGEPVARACAAPDLGRRMITSVDVCVVKVREDLNTKFAIYSMASRQYLSWVGSLVRGSTRDRISRFMLSKFGMPFPPQNEQNEIVDHLEKVTAAIEATIDQAERQTALMEEYRTRLIADVVTGKLDVRKAAEELPEFEPTEISD